MKIALYARVSTKDKGQDYENQLRELRAFVERKAGDGWVLAGEYVDKASGKSEGSAGVQAAVRGRLAQAVRSGALLEPGSLFA
jgi:DNA invertase Pin-like site-specific DNA recombinase